MIVFDGVEVKGTHGLLVPQNAELVVRRRHFVGVTGESEIRSKPRGRQITCDILIHDNYSTIIDIESVLTTLQVDYLGRHGVVTTLLVDNGQAYTNCTYMGFERSPDTPWPLYDYAGTIDGGWWVRGTMMWYQTIPGA